MSKEFHEGFVDLPDNQPVGIMLSFVFNGQPILIMFPLDNVPEDITREGMTQALRMAFDQIIVQANSMMGTFENKTEH